MIDDLTLSYIMNNENDDYVKKEWKNNFYDMFSLVMNKIPSNNII